MTVMMLYMMKNSIPGNTEDIERRRTKTKITIIRMNFSSQKTIIWRKISKRGGRWWQESLVKD